MRETINRFRNKALWVSVLAFIPMLCQGFGWHFLPTNYADLVNSLLSILVVAGILSNPTSGNWYLDGNNKAE